VTNKHLFACILNFLPMKNVFGYKDICTMLLYQDGIGRKFYLDCVLNEQKEDKDGFYDFYKDHHKQETRTISLVPKDEKEFACIKSVDYNPSKLELS